MSKLLVVDSNYVLEKSWLKTGHLRNGTLFGYLKQVMKFEKQLGITETVLCFDSGGLGRSKRQEVSRVYKENRRESRREKSELLKQEIAAKYREFDRSYEAVKSLGIRALRQAGYEGDDLIAAVVQEAAGSGTATYMLSSDEDLYQLLGYPGVSMLKQSRSGEADVYGELDFILEYEILPARWVDVKCIAGCKGDNVQGIPGVGDKTAVRWLNEELGANTQAAKRIAADLACGEDSLIRRNAALVTLPFADSNDPICTGFSKSAKSATLLGVAAEVWNKFCMDQGFRSLAR